MMLTRIDLTCMQSGIRDVYCVIKVNVCFALFIFLQPVSNTCKSLVYGLMVIVLALFDEDTLGELQVFKISMSQASLVNSSNLLLATQKCTGE